MCIGFKLQPSFPSCLPRRKTWRLLSRRRDARASRVVARSGRVRGRVGEASGIHAAPTKGSTPLLPTSSLPPRIGCTRTQSGASKSKCRENRYHWLKRSWHAASVMSSRLRLLLLLMQITAFAATAVRPNFAESDSLSDMYSFSGSFLVFLYRCPRQQSIASVVELDTVRPSHFGSSIACATCCLSCSSSRSSSVSCILRATLGSSPRQCPAKASGSRKCPLMRKDAMTMFTRL